MAAPTIASTITGPNSNSWGTNRSVPLPSGSTTGDLILVFFGQDNPGTTNPSASSGWTEITALAVLGSNTQKSQVYARVLDGGANDTLTITANTQDGTCAAYRITNHGVTNATITSVIMSNVAFSTASAQPNPPSLDAGSVKDWLWIAVAFADFTSSTTTVNDAPSGYQTSEILTKSAANTSSIGMGIGAFGSTATQTQDPGTFTLSATRPNTAWTIAVPPIEVPGTVSDVVPIPGDGQVSLSWTAPVSGGAVAEYAVEYSTDGGSSWPNSFLTGSTGTTYLFTGLTNDTSHLFRVAGVNTSGTGDWTTSAPRTPNKELLTGDDKTFTSGAGGWTGGSHSSGKYTDSATDPATCEVVSSWFPVILEGTFYGRCDYTKTNAGVRMRIELSANQSTIDDHYEDSQTLNSGSLTVHWTPFASGAPTYVRLRVFTATPTGVNTLEIDNAILLAKTPNTGSVINNMVIGMDACIV